MLQRIYTMLAGCAVAVCAAFLPVKPAYAVNTGQIAAATADMQCMEWSVVGVCFWLKCYPCKVRTSIKVKHYIPEVVVSSYANTGANPWSEVAFMSPQNTTAKGSGFLITPNQKRDNLPRFKNADVIGHPSSYILNNLNFDYTCESATTGFRPYYLSTLDATAWRWGVTEALYRQSLVPGLREIKKGANGWGSVYPRQGFLVQPDDGKAGAVMAQRAADFVVRSRQPHVYTSISTSPNESEGWWPPGYYEDPLTEGDIKTHKWQPLHPSVGSCTVFPTGDTVEQEEQGAYAYALWRPYRCCEPKGAFLFSVGQ